jgi:hypothetical protein
VQTYLPLAGKDQKEYNILLEQVPAKEAKTMQVTWADQMVKKGEIKWRKEGFAEGELTTLREAIVEVLEGRGLKVTKTQRARLSTMTSTTILRKAFRSSITAASFDDLFPTKPTRTAKK